MNETKAREIFNLLLRDHDLDKFFEYCTDDIKFILHPKHVAAGVYDKKSINDLFVHLSKSNNMTPHPTLDTANPRRGGNAQQPIVGGSCRGGHDGLRHLGGWRLAGGARSVRLVHVINPVGDVRSRQRSSRPRWFRGLTEVLAGLP